LIIIIIINNLSPVNDGFLIRFVRDNVAGGDVERISLTIVKSLGIIRIG